LPQAEKQALIYKTSPFLPGFLLYDSIKSRVYFVQYNYFVLVEIIYNRIEVTKVKMQFPRRNLPSLPGGLFLFPEP
jgi:hypothetical protein